MPPFHMPLWPITPTILQPAAVYTAHRGTFLFMLTNRQAVYGVSAILLGADYFQETLQGRSFYVLPSSIHETILVLDGDRKCGKKYSNMVCEVNEAVVEEKEILSDHAYFYDKENGVLEAV